MIRITRFQLAVATLLLCVGFMWLWREAANAQQRAPEAVAKWEYKIMLYSDDKGQSDAAATEKKLNELAEDGWELTWSVPNVGYYDKAQNRSWMLNHLILRRPKR